MIDGMANLWTQNEQAAWIIVIGALTNVACAMVGCYLVLRRMSLLGDALSHAVLPGLVVAFVLSGQLGAIAWMFAGAVAVGLITAFLTQALHEQGNLPADASMGVVFTSLFALGIVLIKRYGQGVDLDPDCVLFGLIEFAEFHRVSILGYSMPRALATILPSLAINLAVIGLLWKELKLAAFDPALATSMGYSARGLHYLLMALAAVTTVASFEQVGSILVVAMLIVPPAAAHLLTDRMGRMIALSAAIGVASAVIGCWASLEFNVGAAGPMAVSAGLIYLAAALFSPRYGVASALVRNFRTSLRIVTEDLLAMLYRLEELHAVRRLGTREATRAVGAGIVAELGLWTLLRSGNVRRRQGSLELTETGRRQAANLVRSHRLWETYLVEQLGFPADHVHDPAERMEHFIDASLQQRILAEVPEASVDPHGRGIPEHSDAEPPPG